MKLTLTIRVSHNHIAKTEIDLKGEFSKAAVKDAVKGRWWAKQMDRVTIRRDI